MSRSASRRSTPRAKRALKDAQPASARSQARRGAARCPRAGAASDAALARRADGRDRAAAGPISLSPWMAGATLLARLAGGIDAQVAVSYPAQSIRQRLAGNCLATAASFIAYDSSVSKGAIQHDNARPDAPAQELAEVEPGLVVLAFVVFYIPDFLRSTGADAGAERHGRHGRAARTSRRRRSAGPTRRSCRRTVAPTAAT